MIFVHVNGEVEVYKSHLEYFPCRYHCPETGQGGKISVSH